MENDTLKKAIHRSTEQLPPTCRTQLCLHGPCSVGGAPWCSATPPSPSPGLQRQQTDLGDAPWPPPPARASVPGPQASLPGPMHDSHACVMGLPTLGGHPATARLPHPTSHAGWHPTHPPPWFRVTRDGSPLP